MANKYEVVNETDEEKASRLEGERIKDSNAPLATRDKYKLSNLVVGEGNKSAYNAVVQLLKGKSHHFLTLVGGVGRGKTHLALGALWKVFGANIPARYWQCEALLDDLRDGYQDKGYRAVMDRVQKARFLVLDDMGTEKSTEWTGAKLDQIIDYRYENNLPTIVTTNFKLQQLAPRIASRLSEGVVVVLTCEDYRRIKGKNNVRHDEAVKSKS